MRTVIVSVCVSALTALTLAVPTPAPARTPDGLEVTGWILQGGSDRLVARNADGLTVLSVAAVGLSPSGGSVATPGPDHLRLLRAAHRHGLSAELLLSNWSDRLGDFDPRRGHALLSRPERVDRVARRLATFVEEQGWDGVNVDLERVRAADGPGLLAFVEALQARMPAERTVSIDVSAATTLRGYRARGYRLAGLAEAADVIDLMTYDLHGPWSGPGPVGALRWQRRAVAAALGVVPADRLQLGVAGYGYTWPRRGVSRGVTIAQARRLVARDGATARWHAGAGEWMARLADGTVLWWSDGRSYERRVALARELGLRGLAVWRLGSADPLG